MHMYTYGQTAARPRVLYTGSARDRQMGSLLSPARHSESYMFLKEEGAGEKKEGVWSVVTGFFLIPAPD